MARNEEKAMGVLNRYVTMRQNEGKKATERRPYIATECDNLFEAEKWRQQVLKEVGRKISEIQNMSLGEHRIRDLNDEINKLLREKGHWEKRIVELGGQDWSKSAAPLLDKSGREVPGGRKGYKYFGAAKELPGVKELFEADAPAPPKRTRHDMFKHIMYSYYGWVDDDDGVLAPLEVVAQQKAIAAAVKEYDMAKEERALHEATSGRKPKKKKLVQDDDEDAVFSFSREQKDDDDDDVDQTKFKSHVPLPDRNAMEKIVLEKRKQELIKAYCSEDVLNEETEAKSMLGR